MPAALTTYSHSMVPRSVTTPVTRPRSTVTPVAGHSSTMVAPPERAPLARLMATPTGSARPSSATYSPPTRSSVRSSGHRSAISAGDSSWSSTPKPLTNSASRRSASMRCSLVAIEMCPTARKPVDSPVSSSRRS